MYGRGRHSSFPYLCTLLVFADWLIRPPETLGRTIMVTMTLFSNYLLERLPVCASVPLHVAVQHVVRTLCRLARNLGKTLGNQVEEAVQLDRPRRPRHRPRLAQLRRVRRGHGRRRIVLCGRNQRRSVLRISGSLTNFLH